MKLFIMALSLGASSAFATVTLEDFSALTKNDNLRPPCRGLRITAEQKATIKSTIKAAREEAATHREAIGTAKKALKTILMNAESSKDQAVAAGTDLRAAIAPVKEIQKNARLSIGFDILSGEQRVKVIRCRSRHDRRGDRRTPRRRHPRRSPRR